MISKPALSPSNAGFVHLHVHSAYSLLKGSIKIAKLGELAKADRQPALALTDTDNMFGALEFSDKMAGYGIQPIIGCELAVDFGDQDPSARNALAAAPSRIVLLAARERGYRSLMRLNSRAFLETPIHQTPHIKFEWLQGDAEDLIALTGGPDGPVSLAIAADQAALAATRCERLAGLFGDRLYIELQRHGIEKERRVEAALIDLAYAKGFPLVATNEPYFATSDDYEAHDALLCIAGGRLIAETDRDQLTPDHRFKTRAEMAVLFADIPEALASTVEIAERCAFRPVTRKPILPRFTVGAGSNAADAESDEAAELRRQAGEGLSYRLGVHGLSQGTSEEDYRARLAFELDVITRMNYAGYFLIVSDFIKWAKAQDIPVGPGRGSGAGSLVAWALTITDLDPIRFGLLFERFLNPERVSMPDFDIDFCQNRRDEVIRYVQERYGSDRVAQIITFGKLQARAVLRDVGRVLGMPYGQVDRICKMVPNNPAAPVTLQQAIDGEPMLQQMRDDDSQVARLIEIALQLEGLYRHASTHAAGVVIGDRPLDELVPLYRDPRSSMPVTQFSMKYVEAAGLVKFDFLGLKTLTVLAKARDLLAVRGVMLDLGSLPLDDSKTYRLLARGETVGVFQLEGAGMRDVLKKLDADRFEDIVAVNALYRPGPMENIPRYIAVKHGNERPEYMHPDLEPILEETQGIVIYQEQVMEIAKVLSGYSLGSADLLRRAMGKKIKSEMEAQRKQFIDGAKAHGVGDRLAEHIFEQVAKFAGYGFNKSHAAAYALVAYQTAYLKANYPVEFMAASMTLDLGNTDKLNVFRQECDRLGIKLLPPDINRSDVGFAVEAAGEDGAIRYALAAIKGVGSVAMQQVIAERASRGPFNDLFDFAARIDPKSFNKRQFESLVKAGAFDAIAPNRAQAFAAIELLLRHANAAASERASQQVNLFGGDAGPAAMPSLPAATDWPLAERLQKEFEAIGFYLSSHPLNPYGKSLARLGVLRFADLARRPAGAETRVKLAGVVIGSKERTSARGNRFAFLQVSDTSGIYEMMAFAEVLRDSRPLFESGQPLLVTADVRVEGDTFRLTAQRIEALDKVAAGAAAGLRLVLEREEALPGVRKAVATESGGRGRVSVVVALDDAREVEIALPGGFKVTPRLAAALQTVPGIREVAEI